MNPDLESSIQYKKYNNKAHIITNISDIAY